MRVQDDDALDTMKRKELALKIGSQRWIFDVTPFTSEFTEKNDNLLNKEKKCLRNLF